MNRSGISLISVCVAVIATLSLATQVEAFFQRGSIDHEFSYTNLKIIRDSTDYGRYRSRAPAEHRHRLKGAPGYERPSFFLQGYIENVSGSVQREVIIDFFAGDCVMGDSYWTTSVFIAAIKPYQKIPFRNFISYSSPKDPCKFRFSVVKSELAPAPESSSESEQEIERPAEAFPAALQTGGYATVRQSSGQVSVEGEGSQLTETFTLNQGRIHLESTHGGNSDFQVLLVDAQGRTVAVLVEASGRQQATRTFHIPQTGTFLLDVIADGPWSIRFATPTPVAARADAPEGDPTQVQIHLKDGRIIQATACRIEGDLVKYMKFGATISIDLGKVADAGACVP